MLHDTWLIFRREMTLSLRNPAWVLLGATQPILYLALFGPLMNKIVSNTPGFPAGDSWVVLTPALVVQVALLSSSFAGFGLLAEYRSGVLERMRVTPISRVALLLGKVTASSVQTMVQAVLLVVMAVVFFGLRVAVPGVLLALLIAFFTAVTLSAASYAIALRLKSEQAFPALLNAIMLPLILLSGILLPITQGLAPKWLYFLSRINPFSHVVDAERAGFRGDYSADGLLTGSVVLAVLTVLTIWWGSRTFQRENA